MPISHNLFDLAAKDWISKNPHEKTQTFDNFKAQVRNWDIDECIIFEMWDEQADPNLAE